MREYTQSDHPRRLVREMAQETQPLYRFSDVGPQALSVAELLSIVLQTSDALDLAQELVNRFGSLRNLALATVQELQSVRGIGEAQAARIKSALELGRRLFSQPQNELPLVSSPADAYNLVHDMMLLDQEHLRVILLNTRNRVIDVQTVYIGSTNTSVVRIGEVFRTAVRANAVAIIVAHCHPSGDPSPSPEDIHVTRQLVQAGKLMDIDLLDHLVVGHNRYVSMKERGLGFD